MQIFFVVVVASNDPQGCGNRMEYKTLSMRLRAAAIFGELFDIGFFSVWKIAIVMWSLFWCECEDAGMWIVLFLMCINFFSF